LRESGGEGADLIPVPGGESPGMGHPDGAPEVFGKVVNVIVGEIWSPRKVKKTLSVEAGGAPFGARPEITAAVLQEAGDLHLREAVTQGVLPVRGVDIILTRKRNRLP